MNQTIHIFNYQYSYTTIHSMKVSQSISGTAYNIQAMDTIFVGWTCNAALHFLYKKFDELDTHPFNIEDNVMRCEQNSRKIGAKNTTNFELSSWMKMRSYISL